MNTNVRAFFEELVDDGFAGVDVAAAGFFGELLNGFWRNGGFGVGGDFLFEPFPSRSAARHAASNATGWRGFIEFDPRGSEGLLFGEELLQKLSVYRFAAVVVGGILVGKDQGFSLVKFHVGGEDLWLPRLHGEGSKRARGIFCGQVVGLQVQLGRAPFGRVLGGKFNRNLVGAGLFRFVA